MKQMLVLNEKVPKESNTMEVQAVKKRPVW